METLSLSEQGTNLVVWWNILVHLAIRLWVHIIIMYKLLNENFFITNIIIDRFSIFHMFVLVRYHNLINWLHVFRCHLVLVFLKLIDPHQCFLVDFMVERFVGMVRREDVMLGMVKLGTGGSNPLLLNDRKSGVFLLFDRVQEFLLLWADHLALSHRCLWLESIVDHFQSITDQVVWLVEGSEASEDLVVNELGQHHSFKWVKLLGILH